MLEHSVKLGRRLELGEVATETGIHRTTLSKMVNRPDYNCTTNNLDLLCRYFDCALSDIAVYEADPAVEKAIQRTFKGPRKSRKVPLKK